MVVLFTYAGLKEKFTEAVRRDDVKAIILTGGLGWHELHLAHQVHMFITIHELGKSVEEETKTLKDHWIRLPTDNKQVCRLLFFNTAQKAKEAKDTRRLEKQRTIRCRKEGKPQIRLGSIRTMVCRK